MFRVIIAGGRNFSDYDTLKDKMDYFLCNIKDNITVVCGMAKGADLLGRKYALEHNYNIEEHPANWDLYGKSAGYIRNMEMANEADALVAFWNGKSHGTKHMIDAAKDKKLKVRIVYYDNV